MTTPDITLYTGVSKNGVKASIVLEELGIPYKVKHISFKDKEQHEPWYLKINPGGKIPAITDGDFHVFESAAIGIYLCENYDPEGKLLPKDPKLKSQVIQWVMFEASGLGPAQAQAIYFAAYSQEKVPQAIERFVNLTKEYYYVLNNALEGKEYLVGNKFTLADSMCYPWVRSHFIIGIQSIDEYTNLTSWIARIDARPATQKGLNVPIPDKIKEFRENPEKLQEHIKYVQSFIK
ncbi:hypothetical protein RclHR1_00860015 [Rhizophagus clarus]|uniref:Glutathione S-transferase n=1 Tax=Rhizophagus clarus TaxID=94130 RepID=A0A2Z6SNI9_9GLOM|nr:hypothetical protein RclHR1_00860015 [Rhizophagus clarus]GES86032.1 glutathione S-transferase [Rhizophagus clarus]